MGTHCPRGGSGIQRTYQKKLTIFRPAYKPHSVQRGFPVYARPFTEAKGHGVRPVPSRLDGHLSVQPTRNSNDASSVSSLLGLAPGGGYLAARIAADAGGLLHHLFTMTTSPPAPLQRGAEGGLFLWPYPVSYLTPGFPRCRALWSADFPRSLARSGPTLSFRFERAPSLTLGTVTARPA